MTDAPLLIAGAGIGGLALATALRRHGRQALVLEERDDLSEAGAGISLWPNALAALDDIGVGDAVRDAGCAVSSGSIRRADGRWVRRLPPAAIDAALGEPMVAIHRATLLEVLANGAGVRGPGGASASASGASVAQRGAGASGASAADGAGVRTGAAVRDVQQHADGVTVTVADGTRLTAPGLVGADGIRSAVAAQLDPNLRWRYSGYTAWRAVADVGLADLGTRSATWGSGSGGNDTDVEPAETWGPDGEFGYVALGPDRTYWFTTQIAPEGQTADDERAYLTDRLADWHEPIATLLANTTPDNVLRHDIYDRSVAQRWASGRVALLGDAAHPMRPHLGQGGCQAIIDAVVLARLIAAHDDLPTAFARFDAVRRKTVTRIVRQSALGGAAIHARWPFGAATRAIAQHVPERLMLRQLATVAGAQAYRRAIASAEAVRPANR